MAFASSTPTLGKWIGVDYDQERSVQVQFRLRRLDDDSVTEIDDAILKKYGQFKRNPNTGVKERVVPPRRQKVANKERGLRLACAAWTGTRNAWVRLITQDDAELYAKWVGRDRSVPDLEPAAEICIDGNVENDHPAAAIKRNVLLGNVGLTNRIVVYALGEEFDEALEDDDADELDVEGRDYPEEDEEEDLKKTSSAPSSFVPAIPRSESV